MKMPIFVEILSRSKEVRHRHRVEALPICIGRGYDNDIILDDPHIAVHHAVVDHDADSGLTIKDRGSLNGIVLSGQRKTEIALDGNTIFKLGHTNLRIRQPDFNIEEEVAVSRFHNWEGWPPALTGIVLVVILASLFTWITSNEKQEAPDYLVAIGIMLSSGIIWSGIWAFANRLFGKSTRLGRHIFIFGCGVAALLLWDFVASTIAYAFSFEVITRYSSHISIAIIATIVFFHLKHINTYRTRYLGVVCITLSVIGSGMMLVINYSRDKQLADELFMSERFPPAFRLSADKPVATFISDAAKLKAKVDRERTNEESGDEEDNKEKD